MLAHSEEPVACHTSLSEGVGEGSWDDEGVLQCAGAAIYRSNICKSPRDPQVATLPADRETVFGFHEFEQHHGRFT